MAKTPPSLERYTQPELAALLERIRALLPDSDYQMVSTLVSTVLRLEAALSKLRTVAHRIALYVWGVRSEKSAVVLPSPQSPEATGEDPAPVVEATKKPRRGHGRRKSTEYPGAVRERIDLVGLDSGSPCPGGCGGKLYAYDGPKEVLRFRGQAPIALTVYECERLQCNLCRRVVAAPVPPEAGCETWDPSVASTAAVLKYSASTPLNRLSRLQECFGIPLSATVLWDRLVAAWVLCVVVFQALIEFAAQGEVMFIDDTRMRVLKLPRAGPGQRKGVFTTGFLSKAGERRAAIYVTGSKHAGENLADVLERRQGDLAEPIRMADALSSNDSPKSNVVRAACLVHGRRKFVELLSRFPDECTHVIEVIAAVYRVERFVRYQRMDDATRLDYHQRYVGPRMTALKTWFENKLVEPSCEPNSALGAAIRYMLKHWEPMTLFLRQPGAPIDNNPAENLLRVAVLHRRNALYYRTEKGAQVGDLFMSLIATCRLNGVEPMAYLTALQKNHEKVSANPAAWLPWCYAETMAALRQAA